MGTPIPTGQHLLSLAAEEPSWMLERRKAAFELFKKLPLPTFTYGIGILVDVKDLDIESLNPTEQQDDINVIADQRVDVLPLKAAFQKYHKNLNDIELVLTAGSEETKLAALHAAFLNSGLVIRIPEGITVEQPIILNLNQTTSARIDDIIIIAEQGSKAVIIEHFTTPDDGRQRFRSQVVSIIAKGHSAVEYQCVQNAAKACFLFSAKRATAAAHASVAWVDCCIGGTFTQSKTTTSLDGMKASGTIQSIFFGSSGQRYDIYAGTTHHAPETTSDLRARGVLTKDAKSTFRGLIRMERDARGCEGFQKEEALLIGDEAKADAVPILEIENNDVKCGHATSIGYVDEEKLFYMTSRGLSEEEAKQQIVEGFLGSMIAGIHDEKTQQCIIEKIEGQLDQ